MNKKLNIFTRKFKLLVYIFMLLLIPAYIIKKISESILDVAVVQVNQRTFTAPEAAIVEQINVYSGEKIASGTFIMKLKSKELDNELQVTNSNIDLFNLQHKDQLLDLKEEEILAKKDLQFQQAEFERYESYRHTGAVSLMMIDNAYQNVTSARNHVEEVSDKIRRIKTENQHEISVLEIQKTKILSKINNLTIITKEPVTVNQIFTQVGQSVNMGENLILVDNGTRIVVKTNNLLSSTVNVKVGWSIIKCRTINVSDNNTDISIIGVNKEKSAYLLKCPQLPEKYLVDNQFFYIWD